MEKPLQEHTHLFVNGKFKVQCDDINTCRVRSYSPINNSFALGDEKIEQVKHVSELTLIARPISDMTDEEIKNSPFYTSDIDSEHKSLLRNAGNGLNMQTFLYLLSIGVYPFEQKAFEIGSVIDATTL